MALVTSSQGGDNGGLAGEKYLVIKPIVDNGNVIKRLPANVLIKYILVKSTVDTPSFRFGTAENADNLIYETTLPEYKTQSFAPAAITNEVTELFVSGYVGGVVSIIIIYQPFRL